MAGRAQYKTETKNKNDKNYKHCHKSSEWGKGHAIQDQEDGAPSKDYYTINIKPWDFSFN